MAKTKTSRSGKAPKIVGANAADKQTIALAKAANKAGAAAPKAAAKTQTTKRGDQAPEAKKTPAAKSAAAQKLFDDADQAQRVGLPPDMTREQHENHVRRAALGY